MLKAVHTPKTGRLQTGTSKSMKAMAQASVCTRCYAAAIWSAAAAVRLQLDHTFTPLPAHIDAFTASLNSKKAEYAAFASAAFTLDIM